MQRKKKFFRKKRRMAASMFSWLLAFAIVVSSVSTAPGFAMTALAAENEVGRGNIGYSVENPDIDGNDAADGDNATVPDGSGTDVGDSSGNEGGNAGSDDSGNAPDTGDGTESEGSDNTPGSGDGTESEGSGSTPGTGDGTGSDDSSTPDTDDGNGSGDTGEDSSDSDSEGDDTITDEDGTEEDGETPDEEEGITDDEEPVEEVPDEPVDDEAGERVGEVNITLYFYNALKWDTVNVFFFENTGVENTWPGNPMTEESDGWYKAQVKASGKIGYIFNNGGSAQTANAYIEAKELDGKDNYELWVHVREDSLTEGKYNAISSSVRSPEVNGDTVTFRYKNDSLGDSTPVYLVGTMNGWNTSADKMEKDSDGVFALEKKLDHGEYQYKFYVDDNSWQNKYTNDPANHLYSLKTGDDGVKRPDNSLVYVPGSTTYNYTVHYYNPEDPEQEVSTPDLHIWDMDAEFTSTDYDFVFQSAEESDGISWLTTTFSVPYTNLGMIGRITAGSWDGGQDDDREYHLTSGTSAELWYVHGQGVYDRKPLIGNVTSVEASMYHKSMDYTRNDVLKLVVNESEYGADLVAEAYVNASALGMSDKLAIDPELLEISLSVTEDTAPGSYVLPITVIGKNGSKQSTTVTVEVTAKPDSGSDFDWDEAVIYFMVTDRFFDGNSSNNAANGGETYGTNAGLYHGGDFAGVTQKLDYLDELGVNTIWITPIVENIKGVDVNDEGKEQVPYNAAYHGYWASDFTKLNPALGSDEEFQALIDAAHARGMKIMVDVVLNHAGYGAEENFKGMLRDTPVDDKDYVHGGGQANLPDFLTENAEVRDQLIEWQVNWAGKGVDYFRVDTVKHVDSTTWMAFKNELTKANPEFKMIGEYYGAGSNWNGGVLASGQMDSVLDFDFNDWALSFVKGNIASVEQNLAQRNTKLNNTYLTGQFLSSHDENGFKFSLGNDVSDKDGLAMVAATLQITAKGQPVIYYGEEIGLTGENNYPFQDNRYDFDWEQVKAESGNKTYAHYKKMLAIRERYSDIFAKGDRAVVADSDQEGYDVISRSYNGETVYVAMNIGSAAKEIEIPVNANGITKYTDLYDDNQTTYEVSEKGTVTISIPAAADGGTIVLTAGGYMDTLVAPELTIAKGTDAAGKVSALPDQLTHVSEDGTKTLVDVTYSMEAVEGVTLDGTACKITVNQAFAGDKVTLKATAKENQELSVTFTLKVVEDKNEITLRLHYTRPNSDYEGWNVWAWGNGVKDGRHDFDSDGENGEKVATFILEGRKTAALNYIIRKSVEGNEWLEKDVDADRSIDLSNVLSGTIDYYVQSGVFKGEIVLGDDVLFGVKVLSAVYNKKDNTIKVVTGMPVVGKPAEAFTLKGAGGKTIPITKVTVSTTKKEYVLSLGADLSQAPAIAKEYFLGFDGYDYMVEMPKIYSTEEFEAQYTYDGDDLGAAWSKEKTTFKVWAPTADEVKVNLYRSGTEGTDDLIESIKMTPGEKGVWSAEKAGDLNGTYYTYTAVQDGKESEACDPYARTTGVNGNRAMVIDLDSTNPAGWANDSGPNQGMSYNDSVIYELHVRDFSIDESSGISDANKGKFLGLTEKGTTNATGQTTGLDYLVDLGVTHLHLLPIYDYATVDETKLDTPQFNWGYDPKNYNTPEGSYSTDPYDGAVRVKEMKQMVKTLHDNDINVIMDVVYNHVYDADEFCFNKLVPKYFSRTNEDGSYSSGSGCGNDTASERAMVKKYIVDSVNYWADEYHIDGFRFDLVGLLDTETINEVVNTVHQKHPDVVFYGEGWTMDTALSKDGYTMATQANSAKTPQFAYFSDTIRDAIKGDNFGLEHTGFVNGATGLEQKIADCFKAATSWCKSPTQTVNYASCHDNYTLWDKISESRKDASEADRIRMNNLAAAIYMMSEGIPLIHAGEEILRTKPSVDGNGVEHNSYNLPDSVNSIKWNDLDKEAYRNVRDYYKGLIEFRKNHAALRLTSAADVKANVRYQWITNEVVMFVIGGKDKIAGEVSDGIVVIFNATTSPKAVNLYQSGYGVAEGTWNICINDQKAGIETLASVTDGQVEVAPISAMVLVKGEAKDQDSIYDKNELVERKLQALKKLIATCENLEQGNYTEESWKEFTDALAAAKTTAGKTDVTAEEIDSAMDQLRAAYDGLEVPAGSVDTGKLTALVEKCSELTEQGNYTNESWAAFQEALKNAKDVLAKPDVTQEEIDQALEDLQTAYDGLKVPDGSVDTGKLSALIEQCDGLTEQGNYTNESWATFQEALKNAKEVLAKPDATQTEIDQALAKLQAAYDGLEVPAGSVDTGKLKALVEQYRKIQPDDYTEESWNTFQTALKEAERVLEDPNVTQEEIDQTLAELKRAHAMLEKLEDVPQGLWTKWADASIFTTDENGLDHITYTGKAIKPVIQVYDGRRLLKEKTDYTVAYKQNTNAGEAVVTVKGKGNYSQYLEKRFTIDKVDIDTLAVTDLYGIVAADNKKQVQPKPVVKYNGKALKLKTDYTVAYKNTETDGKTPGTYEVILQSTPNSKNYTGSKTIQMILGNKAEAVLMSKVSVQKIPAQLYAWDTETKHGKVQTPEVVVNHGRNNQLTAKDDSQPDKSWDYEVIYDTVHTEAGETATITVKGNNKKYFGEKTVSFKITGTPLKANIVSLKDVPTTGLVYTGMAQEPEVEIAGAVEVEAGYKPYNVVYQKNTDVGTATVTVTGINGYTGTVKKTFKITAYDIQANEGGLFAFGEENKITDQIPYAKGGSKLTDENVSARFTNGNGMPVNLEQGVDYTLSYKKNTAAGNPATVSIKGKGNYKGTIKDVPFTIVPQDLGKLTENTVAGDILVKKAQKYNTVIPVITDLNGKKLKNKTDFTVDKATAYTYADGSAITETPAVDSVIKVTATAKGDNYTGQVSAEFRVIANDKSIASARIKVEPQKYTGWEVKPGKEAITVEMKENGKWVEIDKSCFEITGYTNNIKKGTAKVTIHGIGEYGGSKTVSFKIDAKPMILGTR